MDERVVQFRIGVMILASVIIAAILLVMFGEGPELFRRQYILKIRAPESLGVTARTPVRQRGILIGRVRNVELDEEATGVIITAEIDQGRKLRTNEVCEIKPGLLGESEINFSPPTSEPISTTFVEPGGVIEGLPISGPIDVIGKLEGQMAQAITAVSETSVELRTVIQQIGGLLDENEERINSIMAQADTSMGVVQEAVGNVNDLISDPLLREQLRDALAEAPAVIRQIKETAGRMNQTFDLVDQNLRNFEGLTRPLGERGEVIVSNIEDASANLDRLVGELLVFSETLNSGQGTLGELMNNPDLYQNLNRAAANIEDLSRQIQPIIHDARVFSNKIARHPELLGVRGAIQRNAGTKGVPRFLGENQPAVWAEEGW